VVSTVAMERVEQRVLLNFLYPDRGGFVWLKVIAKFSPCSSTVRTVDTAPHYLKRTEYKCDSSALSVKTVQLSDNNKQTELHNIGEERTNG